MSQAELSQRMADLARALRSEPDLSATMDQLVNTAVDLVDSCEHAGITFAHRNGTVGNAASSSSIPVLGDQLQQQLGEGPCIDAAWEEEMVHSGNLNSDERWPRWGPQAANELGAHSMLCVQLFTHEERLGALNLYSGKRYAFDRSERTEALAIAAHAAVALAAAQRIDQLDTGIARRTVLGQATGILMERYELDPTQAFNLLRRVSQSENRKVHDLAGELVRTGKTPGV
jgi:GAF domain-containing protein